MMIKGHHRLNIVGLTNFLQNHIPQDLLHMQYRQILLLRPVFSQAFDTLLRHLTLVAVSVAG